MWKKELEIAYNWLVQLQNSDGGWSPPYEDVQLSGISISATVLEGLLHLNLGKSKTIERGINFLLLHQQNDGGWPDISIGHSLTLETSLVLHDLLLHSQERCKDATKKGLQWLLNNQNSDGGWGLWLNDVYGSMPHRTSWAIIVMAEALHTQYNSREMRILMLESIQRGKLFLLSNFKKSLAGGGWSQNISSKEIDPHSTAFSLFALNSIPLIENNLKNINALGKQYLLSCINSHGIWDNILEELIISTDFGTAKKDFTVRAVKWWNTTTITLNTLIKVLDQRLYSKEIQDVLFILMNNQHPNGGWGLLFSKTERPLTWVTAQVISTLILAEKTFDPKQEMGELVKENLQLRQTVLETTKTDSSMLATVINIIPEISTSKPLVIFQKQGLYASKRVVFGFLTVFALLYEIVIFQTKLVDWFVSQGVFQSPRPVLFIMQGVLIALISDVVMRLLDRPIQDRIIASVTFLLGSILLGLYTP